VKNPAQRNTDSKTLVRPHVRPKSPDEWTGRAFPKKAGACCQPRVRATGPKSEMDLLLRLTPANGVRLPWSPPDNKKRLSRCGPEFNDSSIPFFCHRPVQKRCAPTIANQSNRRFSFWTVAPEFTMMPA